jgi:uncharacterized membrane protein YcaP (DUF421 family)
MGFFSASAHDMFALAISPLEKVLRPVIVYLFLLVGLRLAGKRQLAQLNTFDLIVLLSISNTVQNAIIGDDNTVVGGLIGAATLLAVNYLFVRFAYTHPRFDSLLEGEDEVLIKKGKILQSNLQAQLITLSELEAAAHRQGFRSCDEVADATLTPGGSITFVGKAPSREERRHAETLKRLDALAQEVSALRAALGH